MKLIVIDRKTGKPFEERIFGKNGLLFLAKKTRLSKFISYLSANVSFFSWLYGFLMRRSFSKALIPSFIKTYNMDTSLFEKSTFTSFNDFFTRKLKPFPLANAPLILPCEGRYLAYERALNLPLISCKGSKFSLSRFLGSRQLAEDFKEGPLLLSRLCPTDYHRVHLPCRATLRSKRLIPGPLYSVNPLANLGGRVLFSENKRIVLTFETDAGTMLMVFVGALHVGSMHIEAPLNTPLEKGAEVGIFSFGGSFVALLFQKGAVEFDKDLIQNSLKKRETYAFVGSSLGVIRTL